MKSADGARRTTMASTVVLLRLLSLKENSPFILAVDSLAQLAHGLVRLVVARAPPATTVVYLSYETTNRPPFAAAYLDCLGVPLTEVAAFVRRAASAKTLVVVDSLNYIPHTELAAFVSGCCAPDTCLLGCFHADIPEPVLPSNYPSALALLTFIASSVLEVHPVCRDEPSAPLRLPARMNEPQIELTLRSRRKSGRSLTYRFVVNTATHDIEERTLAKDAPDEEALLKDLTTFNLTTNVKQRLARQQVDLPFMQAQEQLGLLAGGAIVYEFEKDDDYDEEDPYEDPF